MSPYLLLLSGNDPCKPHGQWWPEGDEHQVKDEYRQEGEDPSGHGPQVEGAKANVKAMVIAKNNRFISLSSQE
jgi:hypothetical protein